MCKSRAYYSHGGHHPKWGHGHRHRNYRGRHFGMLWNTPPVNVKELDDSYELHVYAAGYAKEDFQVNLKDNKLVIAVDNKDVVDSPNWRRQEFYAQGFERHFDLNEKIDKEAISAKYVDGVLIVTLPKLAGFESSSQDIAVA
jgi:HSP20 family protein